MRTEARERRLLRNQKYADQSRRRERHEVALVHLAREMMTKALMELRVNAASVREQRRRMHGAVVRMLQRKLSAAFEKWQSEAAQMRQEQETMRRALMRLIRGLMVRAFVTWRVNAAEAMRTQHMTGGAVRRMLNRKLSMAFEKWQCDAAEMKAQQMAIRRALQRLQNRKLTAALSTWRDVAAQAMEEADAMTRALMYMKMGAEGSALAKWSECHMWEVTLAIRARQGCIEMDNYRLEVSFNAWRTLMQCEVQATDVIDTWQEYQEFILDRSRSPVSGRRHPAPHVSTKQTAQSSPRHQSPDSVQHYPSYLDRASRWSPDAQKDYEIADKDKFERVLRRAKTQWD